MPICCGTIREEISITSRMACGNVMEITSRMVPQQIGNGNYLPRDVVVNLRFPSSDDFLQCVISFKIQGRNILEYAIRL